jgi:hypothetical protein
MTHLNANLMLQAVIWAFQKSMKIAGKPDYRLPEEIDG